jgi:hypothetical protein
MKWFLRGVLIAWGVLSAMWAWEILHHECEPCQLPHNYWTSTGTGYYPNPSYPSTWWNTTTGGNAG